MDWLPARSKEECSTNQKNREGRSRSGNLREQVEHKNMWPTPRATERMGYYEQPSPSMIKGTHGWSLPAAVTDEASEKSHRMWPTPRSSKIMNMTMESALNRIENTGYHSNLEEKVALEEEQTSKASLNPNWVEWLMGYPPGWTDISDSSENPASQE
jgi:hypothetical protein